MAELQADGVFEEAEGNIRQQLMAAAQLARSAVQARQDAAQRATRRVGRTAIAISAISQAAVVTSP